MEAANSGDEFSGPLDVKVFQDAGKTIHPGRNTIVVAAQRTIEGDGDQYIDVGLTALRPPEYEATRADDRTARRGWWWRNTTQSGRDGDQVNESGHRTSNGLAVTSCGRAHGVGLAPGMFLGGRGRGTATAETIRWPNEAALKAKAR